MAKPDDFSSFPYHADRNNKTSTTFLARLQGHESGAWRDFVDGNAEPLSQNFSADQQDDCKV